MIKKLLARYRRLHTAAQTAMLLGFLTMICFYITAAFAYFIAPQVEYSNAMTVYRGCLEAAPASLAAGVCAGFLGDLILSKHGGKDDGDKKK
jgi:hypothetical protein